MADPDFELPGARFYFTCPAGSSSFSHFFFFPQNKLGGAAPRAPPLDPTLHLFVHFCVREGIVTNEETNAGDGVTHAIDETDTDESKHEKRKSRAKSVTLKDNALIRSNSGKLLS